MAKSAQMKFKTPAGIFGYTHVHAPDTKYGNKYKGEVNLSREKARPFVKACKQVATEEWGPQGAEDVHMPWKVSEEDRDTIIIKAKSDPKYPPSVTDIDGIVIPRKKVPNIGAGTRGKLSMKLVAVEVNGKRYISARLNGVQIINLVEFGQGGFESARDELEEGEEAYTGPEDDEEYGTEAGFGTLVTDDSVDADAGEYETDPDELEDDEDEDF
ncbi:MAG: hypothetical protein AAF608_05245 [Pseudomonadota bacterium]